MQVVVEALLGILIRTLMVVQVVAVTVDPLHRQERQIPVAEAEVTVVVPTVKPVVQVL